VTNFPWVLLILAGVSIFGTIWLFKKRDVSYKHGLKIFYFSIISSILVLSFVAGALEVDKPFKQAPIINKLRTLNNLTEDKAIGGKLSQIEDESFVVTTVEGSDIYVKYDRDKVIGVIRLGAPVSALGEWESEGVFEAEVIRLGGQVRSRNSMK
jgi:hypothetical protein